MATKIFTVIVQDKATEKALKKFLSEQKKANNIQYTTMSTSDLDVSFGNMMFPSTHKQ